MNKRYLVGSQYFFRDIVGFSSKDIDYLEIEENPKEYKFYMQFTSKDKCLFKWKKLHKKQFISYCLKRSKSAMEIGKFLVKEFVEDIEFTIEDLKQLEPALEKLDEKHLYLKVIYNSYIENNDFVLTQEQRLLAYEEYKKARK